MSVSGADESARFAAPVEPPNSLASSAVPAIVDALHLRVEGELFGSPLSPNALRLVRTREGDLAVLKIVPGHASAEAETLRSWSAASVPCPAVMAHGEETIVPSVTHLLLSHVPGEPITHVNMPEATSAVIAAVNHAHVDAPAQAVPLADFLRPRLTRFAAEWESHGLPVPSGIDEALSEMAGDRLLHGDLVGLNLLVGPDGTVTFIDPAGLRGPAEFDAGRWIGRCHVSLEADGIENLIGVAAHADPTLDTRLLRRCVGLELVIEVAHRAARPEVFLSLGAATHGFDERTHEMVELTRRLLHVSSLQ